MSLVTFKDLVIDATDAVEQATFWAQRLGLRLETDEGPVLRGDDPGRTVWFNSVPEPKTAKNRVHLDVLDGSLDAVAGLRRLSEPGEFAWTTFVDPDGQEFCVFVREGASPAFKALEVDAVDHVAISRWWAEVIGGRLTHDDVHGYSSLEDVPGMPGEGFDFAPVPEPRTVKNRVHWDVRLADDASVADLVARGAQVLRGPTDHDPWTVMADPEGNEFCVFPAA